MTTLRDTSPVTASLTTVRSRKTYTLEFKLGVLRWLKENNTSVRATARQFGIHRRMIQRWLESEPELSSTVLTRGSHCKKLSSNNSNKAPIWRDLEDTLLGWFKLENRQISDKELKEKAISIASALHANEFKASNGWLKSWKTRNNITSSPIRTTNHSPVIPCPLVSNSQTNRTFLTCTSGVDDTIHLIFVDEGASRDLPTNLENVYCDYTTPEHNYCKSPRWYHYSEPESNLPVSNDNQEIFNYEEVVENFLECDTTQLKVIVETPPTNGDYRRPLINFDDHFQSCRPQAILRSLPSNSSAGGYPNTDGVLSIANRLSEPVFSLCPEILFLNH